MKNRPRKQKQDSFWPDPEKRHGSSYRLGKRKIARPIATKRPMHITLKSDRARGKWSLIHQKNAVEETVRRTAKRFDIRVFRLSNVGNHLHLGVQARRRRDFQNFLRVVTQAIAFLITNTKKGNPIGRFWTNLACTRVVEWGRDWGQMQNYFEKNSLEANGTPRDVVDLWFKERLESG